MKLYIFSNKCNGNFFFRMFPRIDHCCPVGKIRFRTFNSETFAHNMCQAFFFHSKGSFIENIHVQVFNNTICRNITEKGNFVFDVIAYR